MLGEAWILKDRALGRCLRTRPVEERYPGIALDRLRLPPCLGVAAQDRGPAPVVFAPSGAGIVEDIPTRVLEHD